MWTNTDISGCRIYIQRAYSAMWPSPQHCVTYRNCRSVGFLSPLRWHFTRLQCTSTASRPCPRAVWLRKVVQCSIARVRDLNNCANSLAVTPLLVQKNVWNLRIGPKIIMVVNSQYYLTCRFKHGIIYKYVYDNTSKMFYVHEVHPYRYVQTCTTRLLVLLTLTWYLQPDPLI